MRSETSLGYTVSDIKGQDVGLPARARPGMAPVDVGSRGVTFPKGSFPMMPGSRLLHQRNLGDQLGVVRDAIRLIAAAKIRIRGIFMMSPLTGVALVLYDRSRRAAYLT